MNKLQEAEVTHLVLYVLGDRQTDTVENMLGFRVIVIGI